MAVTTTQSDRRHITSSPDICSGKPCVTGTRIRVQDIYVWHELEGRSAEEITSEFPQLTSADVYAALAFSWDHRQEILDQIKRDGETIEAIKTRQSSGQA